MRGGSKHNDPNAAPLIETSEGIQRPSSSNNALIASHNPSIAEDCPSQRGSDHPGTRDSPIMNTATTAMISSSQAWAERLWRQYLQCDMCKNDLVDPVQFISKRTIVCRKCLTENGLNSSISFQELPLFIINLIEEIGERARLSISEYTDVHVSGRSSSPVLGLGATINQQLTDSDSSLGIMRNAASTTSKSVSSESKVRVQESMLNDIVHEEEESRSQIIDSEVKSMKAVHLKISKLMKISADNLYEKGKYDLAVEFYTRSISCRVDEQGDTGLSQLYGNRSAAYFMILRYEQCCEDCLQSIRYAKQDKIFKMCHRGARAAWTVGNLPLALEFLQKVPVSEHCSEYTKTLNFCKKGKRILESAEKFFGKEEGDQYYRMLLTLFSESFAFRLRFGESLIKRGLYQQAIEVLTTVPQPCRPPIFCLTLAECYYQSGFEYFKLAKEVLQPLNDPACQNLLQKIKEVDDGKQEGNQAFSKRAFDVASRCYTRAIEKARDNKRILRILYCNRAAANKELSRYAESIKDCTKAIENDNEFWKAYARRARCHLELDDAFAAVEDFKKAIQYDTSNEDPALKKELHDAEDRLKEEAKRDKDYYYQLGVSKSATEKEIKLKFRELSLVWHPDKCMSKSDTERARAEQKFKNINEAYSVLSDPQKRREYDYKCLYSSNSFGSSYSRNRPSTSTHHYW